MSGDIETFTTNYDIVNLHYKIMKLLSDDVNCLPEMDKIITNVKLEITKCNSIVEKMIPEENLAKLLASREKYANNTRLKEYLKLAKPMMEKYDGLNCYANNHIIDDSATTVLEERILVIKKYLELANRYCTVNVKWIPHKGCVLCEQCGFPIDGDYCSNCDMAVSKDSLTRSSISKKPSQYNTVTNFMKFVISLMGEQNASPFAEVIADMDRACRDKSLQDVYYTSSEIKRMEMTSTGIRGPYNMKDFVKLLKLSGHSNRNDDKHLIIRSYWGWKLYNVTKIIATIYKLVTSIHDIYKKIRPNDSMINREYLCYKIFQWFPNDLGLLLTQDQFSIIKTPKILTGYEADMKEICDILNDTRYPFIALKGVPNRAQLQPVSIPMNMEDGDTKYSTKFHERYLELVTKLITIVKQLRNSKLLEVGDDVLELLRKEANKQTPKQAINGFCGKFFIADPSNRLSHIMDRNQKMVEDNISKILPGDSSLTDIIKPTLDRIIFLLTANTNKKDDKGVPIPIISADIKEVIWKYFEILLENSILHCAEIGEVPGVNLSESEFKGMLKSCQKFLEYRESKKPKK